MFSPRLSTLSAFAALLSLAVTDPNSVCYSYGVDFVDDQQYFINSLSNDQFTCVSTFDGCNDSVADVLLVDPNGDEYLCSQIPTTPDDTPELSTCPILKSQMFTGEWIILVIGNNGDGNPFAWERDISLDVGPQATSTYTPTVTYYATSTPTVTSSSTLTATSTITTGPFTTLTIPSATAKGTKTATPSPVTTTKTDTFTIPVLSFTQQLSITTKTVTATCTVPKPGQDKPCTYSPTLIHPAALETPTGAPKFHRYVRKADRAVDYEYARNRVAAAKLRRELNSPAAPLEERAPDAPTVTVTASPPVNTTTTVTASPPVTTTQTVGTTTTTTSTLPPATVYSGIFTSTVTLPTPTKTKLVFTTTTSLIVKTLKATFTQTTTVTPKASLSACKSIGGHIGILRI